jgi:hypothetical protein
MQTSQSLLEGLDLWALGELAGRKDILKGEGFFIV